MFEQFFREHMIDPNKLTFTSPGNALNYVIEHPEDTETLNWLLANMPGFKDVYNVYQAQQAYDNDQISAQDYLGSIAQSPTVHMTPDQEKWLDNEIARENTRADQAYQTQMRDTSLLSTNSQLSQLGLSPSNVISVGGASSGVSSQAASQNMHSAASLRQQERINKFNQSMGLAKSLIGAAGSMASSGIYGAALGAVKNSAQKVAASAAHSGLSAIRAVQQKSTAPKISDAEVNAFWNGNWNP